MDFFIKLETLKIQKKELTDEIDNYESPNINISDPQITKMNYIKVIFFSIFLFNLLSIF